jgi:hypothetical protein
MRCTYHLFVCESELLYLYCLITFTSSDNSVHLLFNPTHQFRNLFYTNQLMESDNV